MGAHCWICLMWIQLDLLPSLFAIGGKPRYRTIPAWMCKLFRFTEARTTSRKVLYRTYMPEASRGPCVGTMSQCIGMHDREIQSKENQQGYVAHSTFTLLQTLCCFEALSAKLHYRKTDSKLLSLHCHTYMESHPKLISWTITVHAHEILLKNARTQATAGQPANLRHNMERMVYKLV